MQPFFDPVNFPPPPPLSAQPVIFEALPRRVASGLAARGVATWADVARLTEVELLTTAGLGHDAILWIRSELAHRQESHEVGSAPVRGRWTRRDVAAVPAVSGVYFIRLGAFIKIGCAKDVRKRFYGIQQGIPFRLDLIAVLLPDDGQTHQALERACHEKFAAYREVGEWFREEGALADSCAHLERTGGRA
jgi:hypothetical protein